MIDAAATKPFGFMRFDPGPGMGGHCLPVDPFYLAFKAREHDFYPEFIELAGKVNRAQPAYCVDLIARALNEAGKAVHGSSVLDPRRLLQGRGRRHPRIAGAADHQAAARARRRGLLPRPPRPRAGRVPAWPRSELPAALESADAAAIVTAHPELDYEDVVASSPLVVDFRGVTRGIRAENLVRL